ncbi:MAG: class C beta-lactamase-related serine hydrolase [Crocinitomicaceae bacterium]|nr:class C beta-lactamase-related serine hydrolase [Crocinitomicaceae bacterium]
MRSGTILKKLLKGLLLFFVGIIILLNLVIVFTGRWYLYSGIYNTYLQGKTGPGIFDKEVFYSATLHRSKTPKSWIKKEASKQLTSNESKYLENLEISSLLILHGDTIVLEKYWGDHNEESVSNSFSAAKTFVALLIGCALDEGKIKSLDEPIANYLPAFNKGEKKKITIKHLLWMSSGLDWSESGKNPFSDNAASYYGTDLKTLVNDQEVVRKPGELFLYQSGNSQLLGFIVEKATGTKLTKYAEQKIWSKINAENNAFWSLDKKNGDEKSFCCLYSSTRDFARLGKLIGNFGKWNGEQIISEKYMRELTQPAPLYTEDGIRNYRYGYHTWMYLGGTTPVYYCRGILGQYIISIPSENIVIVRTGFKRAKDIKLSKVEVDKEAFIKKYKYKIGHPADLFMYLRIAKRLIH